MIYPMLSHPLLGTGNRRLLYSNQMLGDRQSLCTWLAARKRRVSARSKKTCLGRREHSQMHHSRSVSTLTRNAPKLLCKRLSPALSFGMLIHQCLRKQSSSLEIDKSETTIESMSPMETSLVI